ncbi:hypothetical protein EJ08DRAFT_443424, partial [Tothia fuscella]
ITVRRNLEIEGTCFASFPGARDEDVGIQPVIQVFRLPWPPSCCLDELTLFVVSDERVVRHLNRAFGFSRIASSAYQK